MSKIKDIGPKDAFAMTRKGALLVDVREPRELERVSYDIEGCINVPLSRLEQRFQEISANRQVIIACQRGNRSLAASQFLVNKGYRKVMNLRGGMSSWEHEGLPVKRKANVGLLAKIMQLFGKKG